MNFFSRFYVKTSAGEQIDTTVHMDPDTRCAICGTVLDPKGAPISDALLILFKTGSEPDPPVPVSQFFTDSDGQFMFGPLESNALYLIKIFKNSIKLRELEIRTD